MPATLRREPVHRQAWGSDHDAKPVAQLERAGRLPVAEQGALLPDAQVGYGLPIDGVLATDGAVLPFAVGVDIDCRMELSGLDLPPASLITTLSPGRNVILGAR